MGNGAGNGYCRNNYNFCIDSFETVVGTGIKSIDRCDDDGY